VAGNAPPRWIFGLTLAGVAVVFAVAWFWLGVLSVLACSGDGGEPFAARASTLGELCDARDHGWALAPYVAGLLVAPGALVAFGIVATVRRDWRVLVAGAAGSVVLLLGVTLPFLLLPGDCSAAQRNTLPAEQCATY
jgi:hypothetical protein